jgi:hypothetical protein
MGVRSEKVHKQSAMGRRVLVKIIIESPSGELGGKLRNWNAEALGGAFTAGCLR